MLFSIDENFNSKLTIFFRLLANVDSRIDLRRFIVELKSLNRYKNELSLDTFLGFNVKNDRDFLVGAIIILIIMQNSRYDARLH